MKSIKELQDMNLATAKWTCLPIEDGAVPLTEDQQIAVDKYLEDFLPPTMRGGKCIGCGDELFVEWEICHGESRCIRCGYPSRTYHYDLPGMKSRLIQTFQYHPNALTEKAAQ